jgi:hypothetical protein
MQRNAIFCSSNEASVRDDYHAVAKEIIAAPSLN